MNIKPNRLLNRLFVALLCAFSLPTASEAGGIILYEISTSDLRLASAGWSARADAPSTVFTNPAGMSRLCGTQIESGAGTIFQHVHFESGCGTQVSGDRGQATKWLPSGSFFYVQPINENLTAGVATLGYFGGDLDYNQDWVGRYYVQKSLLEAFSFVPAVSYQITERLSIGAGVNVMYGFLKQRSAVNNILDGARDGYFTLKDYRFSAGGLFGILYQATEWTRFGIQYLTPVKFDFRSKPNFKNIGNLLSKVLAFTGIENSKVNLDVNVPQSVMLSAYHALNDDISIMGNVGWQQWSNFQRGTITLANTNQTTLKFKNKYEDTWHIALGMEMRVNECWKTSAGVAYDSSAVTNKNRQLDFTVGQQWRIGSGLTWEYSENLIVDLSSEVLWQGDLRVDVNKGILDRRVTGSFKNTYAAFTSANITWLF